MRGYPLVLDNLCRKISGITWGRSRRMQSGIMDIYRREWIFLYEGLESCDDPKADNIRRKLTGYGSHDEFIHVTNKLYISRAEQPWLVDWINANYTQATATKLVADLEAEQDTEKPAPSAAISAAMNGKLANDLVN